MTDLVYKVIEYVDSSGRSPYRVWIENLDLVVKARIQARIARFESGNLGEYKRVWAGVFEAKFQFGPGYRVYFGMEGRKIIVLLVGGDKRTQKKDINAAQRFWANWIGDDDGKA